MFSLTQFPPKPWRDARNIHVRITHEWKRRTKILFQTMVHVTLSQGRSALQPQKLRPSSAVFLSTFLLDDTSHEHVWNSYQKTHLSHISLLHQGLSCIFFWCSTLKKKKNKKHCWWQHVRWEGYLIWFNMAIACSAILLIETISNNCNQLLEIICCLKFATKKLQPCYCSMRSFPAVVQKSFFFKLPN